MEYSIKKTDLGKEYLYEWKDMAYKLAHTSDTGTRLIRINEERFDDMAKQAFSNSIALAEGRKMEGVPADDPGFTIVYESRQSN